MLPEFNAIDPFAFMRQFWQSAIPAEAQPFMPPMTEEELTRKINELKVIESWMVMNMGMLSMQIKALEMQKATIAALSPKDNKTS